MTLRPLLLEVAMRWARQAHEQYHLLRPSECSFAPADVTYAIWHRGDQRQPKKLFVRWARHFWAAFTASHPPSPAERLARFFEENYHCSANVRSLARLVACQHTMLRRQFSREFGTSIIEYRNRVRTEHALRLFAAGEPGKVVADKTGWKSRKNLYRAIRQLADLTRAEVTATSLPDLIEKVQWEREVLAWHARRRRTVRGDN